MFERMDPKTLRTWLILAALVYLVLPYDVFPDFFGLPGRIDDALLMAWMAWFYTNHVRRFVADDSGRDPSGRSGRNGSRQGAQSDSTGSKSSGSSESSDSSDSSDSSEGGVVWFWKTPGISIAFRGSAPNGLADP